MNGATGTALEWALALLHAPAERHRLRQKPLPPGVGEVLAIAANVAPEELERVATRLREPAGMVVEAARFYAREILFHADADAYRTLGVDDDAPAAQIKAHFRLLQIWLHPDRQQSGDDSVFAARINQAWNLLRSEARRRTYDLERAGSIGSIEVPRSNPHDDADLRPISSGNWHPTQPGIPVVGRKRHRVLVVGLLCVCLMLGWLVVRQSEREPEPWRFDAAKPDEVVEPAAPDTRLASADAPRKPPKQTRTVSGDAPASTSAIVIERVEPPRQPAPEIVASPAREREMEPHPPVASTAEQARTPKPERPDPIPPVRVANPRATVASNPARMPVATASIPPARVAMRASEPVSSTVDSARSGEDPGAGAQQTTRQQAPQRSDNPGLFDRLRQAFSRRPPETPDLGVSGDVDYDRIQQVRQVGSKLLQYLGSESSTPPPIWSNASTITRADGLRHDMHRNGVARLGSPRWRIGKTSASFESDYSVAGVNKGTLSVAVVWRENRWLVSSIDLDTRP